MDTANAVVWVLVVLRRDTDLRIHGIFSILKRFFLEDEQQL